MGAEGRICCTLALFTLTSFYFDEMPWLFMISFAPTVLAVIAALLIAKSGAVKRSGSILND